MGRKQDSLLTATNRKSKIINQMDFPILLTGVSVAVASSLFGVFVILRRLALVSDAISHVALPGIALGLLYGFDPFWGALLFLLGAVAVIFVLEKRTPLATETIVGTLFITALALGSILIQKEYLVESLFGSIETVTLPWAVFTCIVSVGIVAVLFVSLKQFVRTLVAQELAQSEKVNVAFWNVVFLVLFAIIIALGIKIVGSLLMGALVVVPAAAAKNIAYSFRSMVMCAIVFGIISVLFGLAISFVLASASPGPFIILIAVLLFILSFLWRLIKS